MIVQQSNKRKVDEITFSVHLTNSLKSAMAFMDLLSSWGAVSPKYCLLMEIEAFIILIVQQYKRKKAEGRGISFH